VKSGGDAREDSSHDPRSGCWPRCWRPAIVAAQSRDDLKTLRQEIESLKASIGAAQRDLQEIKTLLRGTRQAGGSPVALDSMERSPPCPALAPVLTLPALPPPED
jgi:hypothetical protein